MNDWWQNDDIDWKQIRKNAGLPPGSEAALIDVFYLGAEAERERLRAMAPEVISAAPDRYGMRTVILEWVKVLLAEPEPE